MIAHLRGTLLEKHPNQVIIDVQGVGYDVIIPVSSFPALPDLGAPVQLRIYTHVREDALTLFGFQTAEEKLLFEKLISVSGIGPKLAITVLSGLATADLINSIRGGQLDRLVKIPGVGKKTAERMILELREKLEGIGAGPAASAVEKAPRSAKSNRTCFPLWSIWAAIVPRPKRRSARRKLPALRRTSNLCSAVLLS